MTTVGDMLRGKGSEVWFVSPEATVYDALQLMADKNIGVVLVLDKGELVGILSERDYARKVILQGKSSLHTPVTEIMTSKVFYVDSEQTLDVCMALMGNKHIRHLPVLEGGRPVGVISVSDVVDHIISDQRLQIEFKEAIIKAQENYILGREYPQ